MRLLLYCLVFVHLSFAVVHDLNFKRLYEQLSRRLSTNREYKYSIPDSYFISAELDDYSKINAKTWQLIGITPDCFVYTMWLSQAATNLHSFRNSETFPPYKNQRCKDKVVTYFETNTKSAKAWLLVAIDTYGRRVRVQSCMNSEWRRTVSGGIWWTKLNSNPQEYFYTQELSAGYQPVQIITDKDGIFLLTQNRHQYRLYRVEILMTKDYQIKPIIIEESAMDIDPKIVPPIMNNEASIVSNIHINFQKRFTCPFYAINDTSFSDRYQKLCLEEYFQFFKDPVNRGIDFNKNTWDDWMANGIPELSKKDSASFRSLLFQERENPKNGIVVPISSILMHSHDGINPQSSLAGYTQTIFLNNDYHIRLKQRNIANDDQIVIIPWDVERNYLTGKTPCKEWNRTLANNITTDANIKVRCSKTHCASLANDQVNCEWNNNCLKLYKDADEQQKLLDTLKEFLMGRNNWRNSRIIEYQCDFGNLLKLVSNKKFLNDKNFHMRMTYPHVYYVPPTITYYSGYFGYVTVIFLVTFVNLMAIPLYHGIYVFLIRKLFRREIVSATLTD